MHTKREGKSIRQRIEEAYLKKYGRPIPKGVWKELEPGGYLDDDTQEGVELAIRAIRRSLRIAELFNREEGKEVEYLSSPMFEVALDGEKITTYQWAVSILMALKAQNDKEVASYRSTILGGKLLSLEEIGPWIQQQTQSEKDPKKRAMFIEKFNLLLKQRHTSSPGEINVDERIQDERPNTIINVSDMDNPYLYDSPGQFLMTGSGGSAPPALDQLRGLSNLLVERYPWLGTQAAIFVLTGIPPVVQTISARIELKHPRVLSRITLTIDPELSPQAVAEKYASVRRLITKNRHLSARHLHLAIFASMNSTEEKSVRERRTEWNKRCLKEDWKYSQDSNFVRDITWTKKRLLNPDYNLPRGRDEFYHRGDTSSIPPEWL